MAGSEPKPHDTKPQFQQKVFAIQDIWYEPDQPQAASPKQLSPEDQQEAGRWLNEFHTLPDHLVVVVGVSYLEQSLGRLLASSMIEDPNARKSLLGDRGGLNFNNRIQLAHCMGLVSNPTYQILNQIRSIRNQFAHSARPMSFEDDTVKNQVASLPETSLFLALRPPSMRNRFIGLLLSVELVLKYRWQHSKNLPLAKVSLTECEFLKRNEREALFAQALQWQEQEHKKKTAGEPGAKPYSSPDGRPWVRAASVGSAAIILMVPVNPA